MLHLPAMPKDAMVQLLPFLPFTFPLVHQDTSCLLQPEDNVIVLSKTTLYLSLSFSEHPPPIYLNPCSLPQLPIPAHFWISGITFRLLSKTPFPASTHDPSLPQQDSRTTSVEPKAEQEQISFFLKSPIDVFSQKFHILFKFYRKKIMKGRDFPTRN